MQKPFMQEDFRAAIDSLMQKDCILDAFQKGVKSQAHVMASIMPLRLIDTYLGNFMETDDIVETLVHDQDYINATNRVYDDPEDSSAVAGLFSLMSNYLTYTMLSHRWQGKEPLLKHVSKAGSIYAMDSQDKNVAKLQQFCCTAAKCGLDTWSPSNACSKKAPILRVEAAGIWVQHLLQRPRLSSTILAAFDHLAPSLLQGSRKTV
ncbi:hypothetical protein BU15DRAFT_72035 [Melanogaster broomeanus]|nr:hypothetical protein BU15DRAFT_72035 [Melanogaster broomeanus]